MITGLGYVCPMPGVQLSQVEAEEQAGTAGPLQSQLLQALVYILSCQVTLYQIRLYHVISYHLIVDYII